MKNLPTALKDLIRIDKLQPTEADQRFGQLTYRAVLLLGEKMFVAERELKASRIGLDDLVREQLKRKIVARLYPHELLLSILRLRDDLAFQYCRTGADLDQLNNKFQPLIEALEVK